MMNTNFTKTQSFLNRFRKGNRIGVNKKQAYNN